MNSHINGTVHALMASFGLDPQGYREDINVSGEPVHVLDCFVLTNATLCSALDARGKGKATEEMRTNCVNHHREILSILAPTTLILQGVAARESVSAVIGHRLTINEIYTSTAFGVETSIFSFHHPTSQGATNWSGPNRDYFKATVAPLLRRGHTG
jgi:hypothetical protein